jgi:hypothetical protein
MLLGQPLREHTDQMHMMSGRDLVLLTGTILSFRKHKKYWAETCSTLLLLFLPHSPPDTKPQANVDTHAINSPLHDLRRTRWLRPDMCGKQSSGVETRVYNVPKMRILADQQQQNRRLPELMNNVPITG